VFFFVGIAAQIAVPFSQDTLRRWSQRSELAQPLFDRWNLEAEHKRLSVAFSEAGFSDIPVIENRKRGTYAIYVAMRARQTTGPLAGEYPVLVGPFGFGSVASVDRDLTDAQFAALGSGALGSCVQYIWRLSG